MKLFLLTCFAITTIAITSYAQNITPLAIGSGAPLTEVKMKDISGKEVSLADVTTGKGLLVMFSCNTCPWVVKYQARTRQILEYAKAKGLGIIVINSNEDLRDGDDSFSEMKEYAAKQGYNWNYVVDTDSKLANAFGATRTPENFLFNSEGKLVYHGAIDDNPNDAAAVERTHLRLAIDEMTTGREVSVKETRSVGCSIKRKE
ncbi:MAG TPA: thioredoxin family protein [Chitinophagaceae bacterium]